MSNLEETFALQIRAMNLPAPEREYKFCANRKFRFDFAWKEQKLAVEIDGGTWSGGRHTRGKGFQNDCHKFNLAQSLGWVVLRGDAQMVKSGELLDYVTSILGGNHAETNLCQG